MRDSEFSRLLVEKFPTLSTEIIEKLDLYRECVVEGNRSQNLTRILEPKEFLEGHIVDSVLLHETGWIGSSALDLGSGAGVPGMICAILGNSSWILSDSEKKKAEFLAETANRLGLTHVRVESRRAEEILLRERVETIVARAVGPVGRILGWIDACSTWNTLILLKSRGWEEEWKEFQRTSRGKRYECAAIREYSVGQEEKYRILVKLVRNSR